MNCINLWDLDSHTSGQKLPEEACRSYLNAIQTDYNLAIDDVYHDERCVELASSYFPKFDIQSMLDSPIHVGGKVVGAICIEQTQDFRHWTNDEKSFSTAVAGLASILLEEKARRKTQELYESTELRMSDFTEISADRFWETDEEFRLTFNSGTLQKDNFDAQAYLGKRPWEVSTIDAAHSAWDKVREAFSSKKAIRNLLLSFPETEEHPEAHLLLNAKPMYTKSGEFRGYRGTSRDVSELRATQIALSHSQKVEAIGHLTSGIAHDFNNILNMVSLNTEMATYSKDTDQRSRYLHRIEDAVKKGAELTRRLLDTSRAQLDGVKLVPISKSISQLIDFLERLTGPDIELEFNCPDKELYVAVEIVQLENVLINLVNNAKDAMPMGGKISLTIAQKSISEESKPMVEIRLADNGSGISESDLEKVFDPFFTTKARGKGTGLGLSLARGFAHQSNGEIEIESKAGRGTTISILLPLKSPSQTH